MSIQSQIKDQGDKIRTDPLTKMFHSMTFQTDISPVTKMTHPSRVTELECHVSLLQEGIRRSKNHIVSSESLKRQYHKETEEAKQQLATLSKQYEDSQCQIRELAASEEVRNRELSVISKEMDKAWRSELKAIHNHHSVDLAALNSVTSEIQRLKMQLEIVSESEAAQAKKSEKLCSELQALKQERMLILSTIENLKVQLRYSEQAKAEGMSIVERTQHQLEAAEATLDVLRSDELKLRESVAYIVSELEKSKSQESSLKVVIKKLESEVKQLSSELEGSLLMYLEEQVKKTVQINSGYELVDRLSCDSREREAELKLLLKVRNEEIIELRKILSDKETQRQIVKIERDMQLKSTAAIIKLTLNMRIKAEENKLLKLEIAKREEESRKCYEAVMAELESSRANEREMAMKYAVVSAEADSSSRRVARLVEQLSAAQAQKLQMEEELTMLKRQSGQWRKAAEEAAVVLSSEKYMNFVERNGSYSSTTSSLSDDFFGALPKKSKKNVLKKIAGIWK